MRGVGFSESPLSGAHFHGPAKQGQNAPVVIWLSTQGNPPANPITGSATLTPEQAKEPIPADDHHLHFGGGQTETTLTLPPGRHTLQLVLGDWSHVPFNPPIVSPAITVDVK